MPNTPITMNKLRTIIRLREDIHFYSVPHTCIGQKLNVYYTATDVEVFDNKYNRIAFHKRDRTEFRHTTDPSHLCPKHRALLDWSPEHFLAQASAIHEDVEHYIRKILEKTRYQEQAYKFCSGILALAHKVGGDRLAAACRLADSYGRYTYREIEGILNKQLDQLDLPEDTVQIPEHENIRGKEYYK